MALGKHGRKRVKIKKSLGPDFESYGTVKKARRGSQEKEKSRPSTPEGTSVAPLGAAEVKQLQEESERPLCDYCLQSASCNRKGTPEELLICKDCQAKAHPSCMDYSEDLAKRARNSPWQCIDCKTCCICEDAGDPDAMLFCDACDKGYHMSCHTPVLEDKPTGKWVCSRCETELEESPPEKMEAEAQDVADSSPEPAVNGLPSQRESPVQFQEHPKPSVSSVKVHVNGTASTTSSSSLPKLSKTLLAEVPDASDWSIEDVVKFFFDMGFTDQAETFREQEIDGKSLLLLKRSDVLTGLSFKLGPALKIYAHVQQLQMRGQPLQ